MRCPSCSAHNVDRAAWCSQCFLLLTGTDAATPSAPTRAAPAVDGSGTVPQPVGAVPGPAATPVAATRHDVRERDGEVDWRCRGCGQWSPLAVAVCATCGGRRRGFGDDRDAEQRRQVTGRTAAAVSLVLPGLGHLLMGVTGSGIARAVLGLLWAGSGVASLRHGSGSIAAVLLAGAAVLWVASANDAAAVASGSGRQWLEARRLGVLVAVVTGGLILTVTVTALGR